MNNHNTNLYNLKVAIAYLRVMYMRETDQTKRDGLAGILLLVNDVLQSEKREFVRTPEEESALDFDSAMGVEGV